MGVFSTVMSWSNENKSYIEQELHESYMRVDES